MSWLVGQASRIYAFRWVTLPPLVGVGMFALIAASLVVAPRESVEGEVQRVFYIHFPSALTAYGALFVVFVSSIALLWTKDMRWDAIARAAAGVGVLFTAFTLGTGAIWGRPTWGVYWTWDARLTSTLILLLLYGGYLLARNLADPTDEQAARYGAVFAIFAFADIPVINMSVRWWRTLHPQPMVVGSDGPAMPLEMVAVMMIGLVGVGLLATWLIVLRSETELLGVRTQALRARLDRRMGV
ncbi:MAG: cytochrome c biogenesis protein CcsA [Dehalococcoidia bacterium]|nr:cytochrome c biogenesis protein CcsA [Dehalococcoidia bacterium]